MTDLAWFLFITFLFDVSAQAIRPLVSLQMVAMGSTPGEIGLLFAASQVLPLIFGMPLGRLSDWIGPVRVIFGPFYPDFATSFCAIGSRGWHGRKEKATISLILSVGWLYPKDLGAKTCNSPGPGCLFPIAPQRTMRRG